VSALLGIEATGPVERRFARLARDLGGDLYVAEDEEGDVLGVVAVRYTQSLAWSGPVAILDRARARPGNETPVLAALVAFAEDRARRRGCRRLVAWLDEGDGALRATLLARGYGDGVLLARDLGDGA
jgi:GNAT superfamily N-acetyltransferase